MMHPDMRYRNLELFHATILGRIMDTDMQKIGFDKSVAFNGQQKALQNSSRQSLDP